MLGPKNLRFENFDLKIPLPTHNIYSHDFGWVGDVSINRHILPFTVPLNMNLTLLWCDESLDDVTQ